MRSNRPSCIQSEFVDQLLRGLCHDVGACARHMIQFSELLKKDESDLLLEDKHKRWLSIIHSSGEEIQRLLSGVAMLSRLSSYASKISFLDLDVIFNKNFNYHNEFTSKESSKAKVNIRGEWPKIYGCEEHWQTLFFCLIENAFKFQSTDVNHIVEIDVCCFSENGVLSFVIEDNGIGIKDFQALELSKPFKRFDNSNGDPGLGMGLTYCDYIAQLNHGSLHFETSILGGLKVIYSQPILAVSNLSVL